MNLLIGKGQSAQKRPYWGEDRIKKKIMSKRMSLIVGRIRAALLPMRLRMANGSSY